MELNFLWLMMVAVTLGTSAFLLKRNMIYYIKNLLKRFGKKKKSMPLPPGDMGWPLIGKMWSFVRAYRSQHPESFINHFKQRYGETGGIYKSHLLGKPSIIVCSPELCRKVLIDDEHFEFSYPLGLVFGGKPLDYLSRSGHKQYRKLSTGGLNGHETLCTFIGSIEGIVRKSLEEASKAEQPVEFLAEVNKISFKVIMTIFLGYTDESLIASMMEPYTSLYKGLFSTPLNIPGFTFHTAIKARAKLAKIIQSELAKRREMEYRNDPNAKRGIIDQIGDVEISEGEKVDDELLVIVLLSLLFAGHDTTGRAATWTTMYLHHNPQVLQKAKAEQEEIIKRRPSSQKGLTLNEVRQMKYLAKVIDETLRIRTNVFALLREAKKDAILNGYLIPKGWKVLVWTSAVHMDPEIYSNPDEFNPSRWDNMKGNAGTFLPFGGGARFCPGSDLARLEISIFLHCFLLNYKLEQLNPGGPINYLPSPSPVDKCLAKVIRLG